MPADETTTTRIVKNGASAHQTESVELTLRSSLAEVPTQDIYAELLRRYDEDPTRDGLLKTPERVEKSMQDLTRGYKQDPKAILQGALFDVDYDAMVIVKDIEMYSLLRAPPAAVLRQGAYRLYSKR